MNAMLNNLENTTTPRYVNNGAKWKSNTHEERYYHIDHDGTVFFRQEDDGKWYASTVIRDARDKFTRRGGRTQARRKYFTQPNKRQEVGAPSYENAELLVNEAWDRRASHRFTRSVAGYSLRKAVARHINRYGVDGA